MKTLGHLIWLIRLPLLLLLLLLSALSCESFRGADNDDKLLEELEEEEESVLFGSGRKFEVKRESIPEETVRLREEPPGSDEEFGKFIPEIETTEERGVTKRPPPFYENYLKEGDGKLEPINLDLDAVAIQDIIPAFAEKLEFSYIVDPKVSGAVTVSVKNNEMSKRELWQLFEQILWMSGAYCSPEQDILHIMPFEKMPQERRIFAPPGQAANVEVRITKIRNVPAKNIIEKIQPFLTDGARATEMAGENAILLVEAPENIYKLESLINLLDRKQRATWPKTAIRCVNVSAAHIKQELAAILPVLGFAVATDDVVAEPGSIHITSLDRLQVIVASAANQEALDELKKWVAILDRSDIGDQERVFVYKVVNSTAEELLQMLAAIFNIEGTSMTTSSVAAGSGGSDEGGASTASRTTTSTSAVRSSSTSSSSAGDKGGPASVFEVPVKIFADGKHNRMVIRTTPRTYAMIKAVLESLDTVPSQVLLQVLIAEIRLNENTQFGLEYSGELGNSSKYNSLYGTNFPGLNPERPAGANDSGFKYFIQSKRDADKFAYIRALAGKGNVKILSSPQVAAVSGTAASIDVGQDVPTVTRTLSDAVGGNNLATSNEVEYRKTGVLLKLTPHVTKGGLITLDIDQEVSAQGDDVLAGNSTFPSFIERRVVTSLSMRDGSTLIVGGIIQEEKRESNTSIPIISQIPTLAKLLGYNDIEETRTELLIMITATALTENTDLEKMLKRYKESLAALTEFEKSNVGDE